MIYDTISMELFVAEEHRHVRHMAEALIREANIAPRWFTVPVLSAFLGVTASLILAVPVQSRNL